MYLKTRILSSHPGDVESPTSLSQSLISACTPTLSPKNRKRIFFSLSLTHRSCCADCPDARAPPELVNCVGDTRCVCEAVVVIAAAWPEERETAAV